LDGGPRCQGLGESLEQFLAAGVQGLQVVAVAGVQRG
jgi:hypothetical protein